MQLSIDDLLQASFSSCFAAGSTEGEDGLEDEVGGVGEVPNFSQVVDLDHVGRLGRELLVDVADLVVVVGLGSVRTGEVRTDDEAFKQLLVDEHTQVRVVGPSVPSVSNVTSVHDFSEELAQVVPRDLFLSVQVVGEDVSADGQVSVVEGVATRPTLAAELLSGKNE